MQGSGAGEEYLGFGEPDFAGDIAARRSEVVVRQMNEVDLESILDLRTVVRWAADPDAFGLLRGMRDVRWAVAEAGDKGIVGMVGAVPLGPIGILCHLAVHDAYRRDGLGARLTRWAVAHLRSRGAGVIRLDSTREAEGLYTSLGFEPVSRRTVYRMPEASRVTEVDDVNNLDDIGDYGISTLNMGDLPEVYGLDRWSFGGDRSALILAAIRLHPGRGLVALDAFGGIKGYLVRSTARGETRLGPFLAESDQVARALLGSALGSIRQAGGGPVEITCSASPGGPEHDFLKGSGFVGAPDRLRMELTVNPAARTRGGWFSEYGTTPYLAT